MCQRLEGVGIFTIGDLGSIEPLHIEVAIRDFPIRSGPSIVQDAWQRIPESRSSAYQGFRIHRNLATRNRDLRFTDKI
jgi:hypothetical protein